MRVVFLLNSLEVGGSEQQALHLAHHLANGRGAEVHVVGPAPAGELCVRCERSGVAWHAVGGRRPWFSPRDWRQMGRLARLLRDLRPDALLPYTRTPNVIAGLLWRPLGAKVCVWNHRDDGSGLSGGLVERAAVRMAPLWVANSRHGAAAMAGALGVAVHRIRVIPNGVALPPPREDRGQWRRKLGVGDHVVATCMLANLNENKDHASLIAAWQRVVQELAALGPPAVLVLAGRPGSASSALDRLIARHSLDGTVRRLGFVDDVAGLLAAVDLCVFSSPREGSPAGVLEPMAMGLPVAAVDNPGVREALGPEALAHLAPPGDVAALADRIVRLAREPGLRRALGDANRQRLQSHFSVGDMCAAMSTLLPLPGEPRRGEA